MGSKSDYLEAKVLDSVFGSGAFPLAATLYFGLFTASPNDAGGGTELTSGSGSYVRKSVTNNSTNFPNASAGSKINGVAITFATATSAWGTLTSWGVFDATSGGNLLYWGALSPNLTIASGDTVNVPSGGMRITED